MDSEQLLCEQLRRYLELSSTEGQDSERTEKQYIRLRDMIIVEIYFMKSVRYIISDEEMSGFILYMEHYLFKIIADYDPEIGSFLPYLRKAMEYKAFSYLDCQSRERQVRRSYIRYYLPQEAVSEPSPEDVFVQKENLFEEELQKLLSIMRLKKVCSLRPARQRWLFILLCTMMPNLSMDIIDTFCDAMNCDKRQTFAIADYIQTVCRADYGRYSREYLLKRRDFYWMRTIELQGRIQTSLSTGLYERQLEYQRQQMKNLVWEIQSSKMHIPYPVLGEILNLKPSIIASAVFQSKKILETAAGLNKKCRASAKVKEPVITRFEPFKVFNINLIAVEGKEIKDLNLA